MRTFIIALAAMTVSVPALAAIPVYSNPGTLNPTTYNFSAVSTGNLVVYYAGASATINNAIGVQINGGPMVLSSLSNSSALGASYNFGSVTAGDQLTFFIRSAAFPTTNYFFSDPGLNGGVNHVWSTAYAGGDFGIPAGTLVAFEDIPGGGDRDYNDISFVFTNVSNGTNPNPNGAVPEPATWAMMIGGFGLIGAAMRRRARAAAKLVTA